MENLKGKVAVVTGGARGIGRAIVLMLAREGCHVAFNYQKSHEQAKALENEVKKLGVQCKAACVDIKDHQAVKQWIQDVKTEFQRLDILVNNAGIIIDKALMLMSEDDWHQVLATHVDGMFNASRACIVTFLKQKSGDIINISSVSGIFGLPRQTNYSAAKGAMNAFTKSLAKEVSAYGIRVNAVAPGFIETDMTEGLRKEQVLDLIPLNRVGRPEDVASVVNFLCTEEDMYIHGQVIGINGGLAI